MTASSRINNATPAYGLYARHVDRLKVSNVEFALKKADERPMVVLLPLLVLQPLRAITRDSLWNAFLIPPDSIRVGCYYYWVNEHVDIRNRTRWENPWEGETFGKNKFLSNL